MNEVDSLARPHDDRPRISVCVLTCGRKDSLGAVLATIRRQTLLDYEVLVVDNGSRDGTREMLRSQFPEVRLFEMGSNVGCVARNKAVENALADIVVGIDDDVLFDTPCELARILHFFQQHPEVQAIDFKIMDRDTPRIACQNWFHPRPMDECGDSYFETDYIAEGATAFRRDAFLEAGGYPDFFLSHEGYDLAYRMINKSYCIMYFPGIVVRHFPSHLQRQAGRIAYYGTRNNIWLAARNFPAPRALSYLCYKLLAMLIYSASRGHVRWYLRGIRDGFCSFGVQRSSGERLSAAAMSRLREIAYKKDVITSFKHFVLRFKEQSGAS